ncbi:MAG TPA: metalloregulator ArsR/SmtB family transcription factor, partial [Dehalococcoidia bacterium]|nr:metalloregulator ArsR/SmtB family transcription factor [Dehalococcoidia bacterium]
RPAILERLAHGEASVTELAEPFHVSLPAISKQLRVLEHAGLLIREKEGRVRRCRLDAEPMKEAVEWLAGYRRYWERQLDSLADYLNELQNEERPS